MSDYAQIIEEWMADNRMTAQFYVSANNGEPAYLDSRRLANDLCHYERVPWDFDGNRATLPEGLIDACQQWLDNTYDGGEE